MARAGEEVITCGLRCREIPIFTECRGTVLLFPFISQNPQKPPFSAIYCKYPLFPSNNKYLIKTPIFPLTNTPSPHIFPPYKYSHPLPSKHSIPTKTSPAACVDQLRGFYIIHPNTIMLLNVVYLRRHSRSIWRCQNDTLC